MNSIIKNMYNTLRYSAFYPVYLRFFKKSIYREYRKEVDFYRAILQDNKSIVFDIGANVGDKSMIFSMLHQSVLTVEPDLHNYKILSKRFSSNQNVTVLNAAVGSRVGKELFYVSSPGSPANTLSTKWKEILEDAHANRWSKKLEFHEGYEVEVITLDSLIKKFGHPYYVKIDVEGFEKQVLEGLSKTISVVSFEANFPDFREETIECVKLIQQISKNVTFNMIDDNWKYFWTENKGYEFVTDWLRGTDTKYFEVFCFSKN